MTGLWTVATAALGRHVPVAETPYPHVCGSVCYGRPGGPEVRLWSRYCAACATERVQTRPVAAVLSGLDARYAGCTTYGDMVQRTIADRTGCARFLDHERRWCNRTDGLRPYQVGPLCPEHQPRDRAASTAERGELDDY